MKSENPYNRVDTPSLSIGPSTWDALYGQAGLDSGLRQSQMFQSPQPNSHTASHWYITRLETCGCVEE